MDNYLIDRETLGEFIDELIKKKPLPVETAEELASFRETKMKELDSRISKAIFGNLSAEKLSEVNQLLSDKETSPEAFEKFFEEADVDLDQVIRDTMEAFAKEFLGGENV